MEKDAYKLMPSDWIPVKGLDKYRERNKENWDKGVNRRNAVLSVYNLELFFGLGPVGGLVGLCFGLNALLH